MSAILVLLMLLLADPGRQNSEAGRTQAPPPIRQLIQQGVRAYQSGNRSRAIQFLRQAYQLSPTYPDVQLLLGLMLYEEKTGSLEAQRLLEASSPRFPANKDLHLKLLDSYLRTAASAKVPLLLDRVRPLMVREPAWGFQILYLLIRYGQMEWAQRELKGVAAQMEQSWKTLSPESRLDPRQARLKVSVGEVLFLRGLLAATAGEKQAALDYFQQADRLEFPPHEALQMLMLAEALYRLEEYPLASGAYEVYLKYHPQDIPASQRLGRSYFAQAMFPEAQKAFLQVLKEMPAAAKIHFDLGRTLLEQQQQEEARAEFLEELRRDPKSFASMAHLAFLDYVQGENDSCRQWLERALALDSGWYETHMVYGLLFNRQGRFAEAISHLEKCIAVVPGYYKAHFQLSLAYRRLGQEAKAEQHAQIYSRLVEEEKTRRLGSDARRK